MKEIYNRRNTKAFISPFANFKNSEKELNNSKRSSKRASRRSSKNSLNRVGEADFGNWGLDGKDQLSKQ